MQAAGTATRPGIVWVQYLRGIAALLVVVHHARNDHQWLYNPLSGLDFGAAGVDIFFVISGFIMFTAARDEPVQEFFKRRIIRIVPLYWAATAVMAVNDWADGNLTFAALAKSLFFVPYANPNANGAIWPILVPGWTLNFEMFFYFLFGLSLVLRRPVWSLTLVICGLAALGLSVTPDDPILKTYTSALMLEFLAGVWLGVAYTRFDFSRFAILLPIGFAILLSSDWLAWVRAFEIMLPSVMIVAGALGLEQRGVGRHFNMLKLIGDASYSIYIFHTIMIAVVVRLYQYVPLTGFMQFIGLFVIVMLVSTIGGLIIHHLVERPVTRALSNRFSRRNMDKSAAPA